MVQRYLYIDSDTGMSMGGVNQTRGGMVSNLNQAKKGAQLIGFNDSGEACIWSGGYTFNVYDAARDWNEIRSFTSGRMVDWKDKEPARELMEKRGFEIVE
jgi:hypothetical protein